MNPASPVLPSSGLDPRAPAQESSGLLAVLGRLVDNFNRLIAAVNHLAGVLANPLTATANLVFAAPGAVPGNTDQNLVVAGAKFGDTVAVGAPATVGANYVLTGFVSAVNTVTVRYTQIAGAAAAPPAGIYRADVFHH